MKKKIFNLSMLLLFCISLASCSNSDSQATQAVESFLNALTNKEEALMISYTCLTYELDAYLEYDAYALVETHLENLSCQETNQVNGTKLVSCQGSIEATYSNEQRSFDLAERTYSVVEENGVWLVCGYMK